MIATNKSKEVHLKNAIWSFYITDEEWSVAKSEILNGEARTVNSSLSHEIFESTLKLH